MTADLDAWAELDARAPEACGESCVFEGGCGSLSYCNGEQRCVAAQSGGGGELCDDFVKRDIDAFLTENAACVEDEDCISVPSCTGGNNECDPVALNTAADMDDWNRLEGVYIEACDGYCDTSEGCVALVRCGDSGRCELAP